MKSLLAIFSLFAATAGVVTFYPHGSATVVAEPPPIERPPLALDNRPAVEVVFVLDTTGSMGGMIEGAKQKIWSIASSMAQAEPAPEIRMGLVAYRDRGDAYITHVVDLSADLDTLYATLMDFEAAGGGDGPEAVNQALHDAVTRMSWSQDQNTYRTIFLVGDAPPHHYPGEMRYPEILAAARGRDIVVNAIQCGDHPQTRAEWMQIAQLAGGRYFDVAQGGGALAMTTPYDAELARLSAELDDTRLFFGIGEERDAAQAKVAATDKLHAAAPVESRARRAAFNAGAAGTTNLLGENELVDAVTSGRVKLEDLDEAALPAALQPLTPEEQSAAIADRARQRQELQREIADLAKQREAFIAEEVAKEGGAEASLDYKVYSAVREQAESKGLKYEAEPDY